MSRHVQVPKPQEQENTFIGRKRELGGYCKHRLLGFSLAESLPGRKRGLSSSSWALLLSQGVRASPLVSQLYLIEVSVC